MRCPSVSTPCGSRFPAERGALQIKQSTMEVDGERTTTLTVFDSTVHEELTADQAGGHDHPRAQACEEAAEAGFFGERGEAEHH